MSQNEEIRPPNEYLCPISLEVMKNPVFTSDGHTFEKSAITRWLTSKDTSPITGYQILDKTLVPNHALRKLISDFHVRCGREDETRYDSGLVRHLSLPTVAQVPLSNIHDWLTTNRLGWMVLHPVITSFVGDMIPIVTAYIAAVLSLELFLCHEIDCNVAFGFKGELNKAQLQMHGRALTGLPMIVLCLSCFLVQLGVLLFWTASHMLRWASPRVSVRHVVIGINRLLLGLSTTTTTTGSGRRVANRASRR